MKVCNEKKITVPETIILIVTAIFIIIGAILASMSSVPLVAQTDNNDEMSIVTNTESSAEDSPCESSNEMKKKDELPANATAEENDDKTDSSKLKVESDARDENSKESVSDKSEDVLSDGSKINVNTATKQELMAIPGIGEKTSQKIIDFRKQIGTITSLEQLSQIDGIGEKTVNKLRDYLVTK